MRIEIVNTGTELLLGQTLNTHGGWLGAEVFKLGLRVARQTCVPDGEAIREVLVEALGRADAVLVTGGLGPTSDDLTREITAQVLGLELEQDDAARASLEAFFATRQRPMASDNLKQVLVPRGAEVLPNANGTAPGVYVAADLAGRPHAAIFLLPGPPRELQPMFLDQVAPRLRALSGVAVPPELLEMKFAGIGESDFHQALDARLAAIPGLEFGYCARIGEVDLRLIGATAALQQARALALECFAPLLVSDDGSSLEQTVVRLLGERGWTLTTAESCSGGLIANRLTDVAGASAVFTHGFVTYSNAAKRGLLGVTAEALASHGAVSEAVACQMAEGALAVSGADLAVAVTGIAGPGGGSADKPVGTAWIAVSQAGEGTRAWRVFQPRNRLDFKQGVSQTALDAVRKCLLGLRLILLMIGVAGVTLGEDLCQQPSPVEMAKAADVILPKSPWHVVNIWWDFEKPVEHFTSLEMTVSIDRDVPADYNLYVSPCGIAKINDLQFYGGLQTNINGWPSKESRARVFPGKGAIFSRWSSDKKTPIGLDHVRVAGTDCLVESAGYEGEFASVRRPFAWTKGTYIYQILKGDSETIDGVESTWFKCCVKDPEGVVHDVGSLRFEGRDFTFWARHSAFVEVYSTAKLPKSGIPKVNISFGWPRLNGQPVALKKASAYYPHDTGPAAPDCAWVKADGEACAVEIGPIFKRDEAKRRHDLPIHRAPEP